MSIFINPLFILFISILNFQIATIDARPNMLDNIIHVSSSPAPVPSMADSGIQAGSSNHKTHSNKKLVIAVIAASSLGVILLPLMCLLICRREKIFRSRANRLDQLRGLPLSSFITRTNSAFKQNSQKQLVSVMDYSLLKAATNNFHESEILGSGGFGCVYKGRLDDNLFVAVKKLDNESRDALKEFQTEVDILSKVQHPNIITLLGYCVDDETKILVYELMQNGSLDTQLHGPSCGSNLTWHCRMKIALDTARGLEYLHEHCKPPVIHRDLKSSNILLDSRYNAKLADFGLAVMDGANKNVKLSGTLGYVAPEYLLDGKLTDKSDVYAFGVVLLELLLKRRPVEKQKQTPPERQSLVTWAMPQLTDRSKLPSIIDPVIRDTMDPKHLYQVAAVAVLCLQPEPSYRPLITDVLHSLVPLVPVELGGTLRVAENRVAAAFERT
ncbi:putative protein kinase RLK-Pelle-RLCK-X family [Helianthus debilis subsp. tardiflorus]